MGVQRLIFALKMLFRHRSALKNYRDNLSLQTETIFDVSLTHLKQTGIKVLVLDYDGVLAGYGVEVLEPKVQLWLTEAIKHFGPKHIFILSNRPSEARINLFLAEFPDIGFIFAPKKPYPDGLFKIIQETKVTQNEVLIFDDRLLTGILASILAGTHGLWVTHPMINYSAHPFKELLFILLRQMDKLLIF